MDEPVVQLAAQAAGESVRALAHVALVLLGAKLLAAAARRVGQLAILGELVAGVVLGPAVLGLVEPEPALRLLAEVGVVLLMFLAGLETDVDEFRRNAAAALWVALAGVIVPFAGGWAAARAFGIPPLHALFVGVLLVATSVSISVETLRELGLLRRREGTTVLAAAVYDDVLGLLALTLVLGLVAGAAGSGAAVPAGVPSGEGAAANVLTALAKQLALIGLFAVLALAASRPVAAALVRAARLPSAELVPAAAAAAALLFAAGAELFGLAGIVGAYLLGLLLKVRSAGLARDVDRQLARPALTFFTPFFFVSVGLLLPRGLPVGPALALTAVLVVVAVLSKLLGCGAGALLGGFGTRSALLVGAAMVARGEVGLIVAAIGRERGIIGPELYTAMTVVAVATTLLAPPLIEACAGRRRGTPLQDEPS